MYTKDQIANIANALILVAKHHLPTLTSKIEIKVEAVGENTFVDTRIGCVARGYTLVINSEWFASTDNQDIKYLIWHEVRHMYQFQQIKCLESRQACKESMDVIRQWQFECAHYVPNSSATEAQHLTQHMEIDAYAFSMAMLFIYAPNSDGSLDIGLPPIIESDVFTKAQQLVATMNQQIRYRSIVDRNADCPCGSGKKYKKCCRKNGFFEF